MVKDVSSGKRSTSVQPNILNCKFSPHVWSSNKIPLQVVVLQCTGIHENGRKWNDTTVTTLQIEKQMMNNWVKSWDNNYQRHFYFNTYTQQSLWDYEYESSFGLPATQATTPSFPSSTFNTTTTTTSSVVKTSLMCEYGDCTRPKFSGFQYCGRQHGQLAAQQQAASSSISSSAQPSQPSTSASSYSTNTSSHQPSSSPQVILLSSSDSEYQSVSSQFMQKWKTSPSPTVKYIAKIVPSQSQEQKWKSYRDSVHNQGVKVFGSGSKGNTHRRFHGTAQFCDLGMTGNSRLCNKSNCAVCHIIRSGWLLSKAGTGLFGKGIYFSSTPSKSNNYNANRSISGGLKSMFVAHVVVGRGYKLTSTDSSYTAPPNGYHSVLGELSNDETIVYEESAAIPMYLILYKE